MPTDYEFNICIRHQRRRTRLRPYPPIPSLGSLAVHEIRRPFSSIRDIYINRRPQSPENDSDSPSHNEEDHESHQTYGELISEARQWERARGYRDRYQPGCLRPLYTETDGVLSSDSFWREREVAADDFNTQRAIEEHYGPPESRPRRRRDPEGQWDIRISRSTTMNNDSDDSDVDEDEYLTIDDYTVIEWRQRYRSLGYTLNEETATWRSPSRNTEGDRRRRDGRRDRRGRNRSSPGTIDHVAVNGTNSMVVGFEGDYVEGFEDD
ncbi:hypothetical protein ABW19_dt0203442 [Dactylella cylindrospora]|nr:hypothetical protein ABW19_dt0203442 [Dactylella cylindrospora]